MMVKRGYFSEKKAFKQPLAKVSWSIRGLWDVHWHRHLFKAFHAIPSISTYLFLARPRKGKWPQNNGSVESACGMPHKLHISYSNFEHDL